MKFKGFIRDYRLNSLLERILNDFESRLWRELLRFADWDEDHKNFGVVSITIRGIKEDILPNWSIGKICKNLKSLENKRFIERIKNGVRMPACYIYRMQMKDAETDLKKLIVEISNPEGLVQEIEELVHNPEDKIQYSENIAVDQVQNIDGYRAQNVQHSELGDLPKETLKKIKETLNEDNFKNLSFKDKTSFVRERFPDLSGAQRLLISRRLLFPDSLKG